MYYLRRESGATYFATHRASNHSITTVWGPVTATPPRHITRDELVRARGERFSEKIFWALSLIEMFLLMGCFGWTFALKILWKEIFGVFFLRKWMWMYVHWRRLIPLYNVVIWNNPPLKLTNHPPEKSWLESMNFLKKTKWSSFLGTNSLDFQGCKLGKVGVEGEVGRSWGPWIYSSSICLSALFSWPKPVPCTGWSRESAWKPRESAVEGKVWMTHKALTNLILKRL